MKPSILTLLLLFYNGIVLLSQNTEQHRIAVQIPATPSQGIQVNEAPLALPLITPIRVPQDEGFNTEGTEFWLTFMQNYEYNANSRYLKMQIVFSSRYASNITVTNPNTGWNTHTSVKANGVTILTIPTVQCYNFGSDFTQNTGLLVQSTAPISVYGANFGDYTFDATNVIPTPSLGTDYIIQAYRTQREGTTEFAIIATEDNTQITMALAGPTLNKKQGTYTFTLQRGQVYQATAEPAKGTLSGTVIKADKPVAVFNGDIDLYLPDYYGYSDHIVEQAMPIRSWGKKFVLTKSATQTADYVMFTALKNGTRITKGGTLLATINTCESFLYRMTDASAYFETSEPCACYLYQTSRTNNSSRIGDPSMVWITPQEQGIKQITFATFKTQVTHYHYMNVVVPTSAVNSMTYDGSKLSGFKTVTGNSEYSYLIKKIDHGTHTLYNPDAEFTAHVYGMGVDESYAYCVGGYLREINDVNIEDIIDLVTEEQTYDICEGQSVTINGKVYLEPATWTDTVGNQIKKYAVVVHPSFLKTDTVAFTQGTTFTWHGKSISTPGTYKDEHTSQFGCDSIYRLVAKYDNVVFLYDTICETSFYKFRGESFALPKGEETYTIVKTEGDKEYRMQLAILPAVTYNTDNYILEPSETYNYHGLTLSAPGEYTLNLTNRFGCDSIVTLTVTQPITSRSYYTICEGETYEYFGQILNQSGTYNHTIASVDGTEKVHQLVLTVEPPADTVIYTTICEGEVYSQNGFHLSKAGTYYQYLQSSNGCDSTITLHLSICQPQQKVINDYICSGTIYQNGDFSTERAGTYTLALRNQWGCDSTVIFHLTEAPSYTFQEKTLLKDDEALNWHGQTITQSGTYTANYTTIHGCDSIYTIKVRKIENVQEEVYDTLCTATQYTYREHTFDIPAPDTYPYDYVLEVIDRVNCKLYRKIITLLGSENYYNEHYQLNPHETILFGGNIISEEGVYTHTFTNRFGCDSIVTLTVTQPVIDYKEDTVNLCSGTSYLFAGEELTRPGTYIDSVQVAGKQGYIIHLLVLNVKPEYRFETDTIINFGQTYTDEHFTESTSGIYEQHFTSLNGCDSIYILHLTVCQPVFVLLKDTIVEGQAYDQNGFLQYEKGTYSHTCLTSNGCDSTTTLELTVLPLLPPLYIDTLMCEGEICRWEGNTYNTAGTYMRTFTLPDGRDSTRILRLNYQPKYADTIYATICDNEIYTDYNFHANTSGYHTQTHTSVSGCDSTITLYLSTSPTYESHIYRQICAEETFSEMGITTSEEGVYDRIYTTESGCDSIVHIHLSVGQPTTSITQATINLGQTYLWQGTTYSTSTYLCDTLPNHVGCDSIVIFDLWVNDLITSSFSITLCEGDSAQIWGDSIVYNEGIYQRCFLAANGADSLVAYSVTVLPHSDSTTMATIQQGEIYSYHGKEFTEQTTYHDTLLNAVGCDSVCTLILTVEGITPPPQPPTPTVDTIQDGITICNGLLPYMWEGHTFTTAGSYTHTFTTSNGDSVVRFTLKVIEKSTMTVDGKTILSTDLPYTWEGHTFTQAGTFTQTLLSSLGCDSIVTFTLTVDDVVPPPTDSATCTPLNLQLLTIDTICANDLLLPIALTITSGQIDHYDIQFSEEAIQQGFAHVSHQTISPTATSLSINVPHSADSTRYPRPDTYDMTIRFTDTCGNISLYPFSFTILYPAWIIQQRWNDVLSLYNEHYNGGYTFTNIEWYYEGRLIAGRGNHNSYIYIEPHLEYGNAYWLMLTRTDDGKTLPTCKCYPTPNPNARTEFKTPIKLIPHPLNRYAYKMETDQWGFYQLYDAIGKLITQGAYGAKYDSPDLLIPESTPCGTYIAVFRNEVDNQLTVVKIPLTK